VSERVLSKAGPKDALVPLPPTTPPPLVFRGVYIEKARRARERWRKEKHGAKARKQQCKQEHNDAAGITTAPLPSRKERERKKGETIFLTVGGFIER